MKYAARCESLTREYHLDGGTVRALRGVDLDVPEGDFVAIMGASGSGKSTLLNLLGCLDHPSSGRIRLGEEDITLADDDRLSEIRASSIGFVFQSYNLIPQLTVIENIEVPLPKLHTFSASFLPQGSLEDLTPALRRLYVSCSAATPWHSLCDRDVERATTTTSLHATRLPASLQLLSVTVGPPGSFAMFGAPPWLAPLLAAVRRNHPRGALQTLMIQAETQHLAELAAAEIDRWLGEEVPQPAHRPDLRTLIKAIVTSQSFLQR